MSCSTITIYLFRRFDFGKRTLQLLFTDSSLVIHREQHSETHSLLSDRDDSSTPCPRGCFCRADRQMRSFGCMATVVLARPLPLLWNTKQHITIGPFADETQSGLDAPPLTKRDDVVVIWSLGCHRRSYRFMNLVPRIAAVKSNGQRRRSVLLSFTSW